MKFQMKEKNKSENQGIEFTDTLYRENILDYYRSPRNFGRLPEHNASYHGDNPVCGDEIDIELKINYKTGKIEKAKFIGRGCAISQSAASMLMEKAEGMKLSEVSKISREDIMEMLGVNLNPTRLKCAILSLKVLEGAIHNYKNSEIKLRK